MLQRISDVRKHWETRVQTVVRSGSGAEEGKDRDTKTVSVDLQGRRDEFLHSDTASRKRLLVVEMWLRMVVHRTLELDRDGSRDALRDYEENSKSASHPDLNEGQKSRSVHVEDKFDDAFECARVMCFGKLAATLEAVLAAMRTAKRSSPASSGTVCLKSRPVWD
ncbi:hypothetical protein FRB96_000190 [Tulasnella sp. 330]|nr:hypothetical protein FRB96_000190 [Tulasnella sp. 330]